MKKFLFAATAAAAVLGAGAANAALLVNVTSADGNTNYLTATDIGTPGLITFSNSGLSAGGAILTGTITGVGSFGGQMTPGLGVNTTSLSASNLTSSMTFLITVTQSGLTYAGNGFDVTNTINGLSGNVASVNSTTSVGNNATIFNTILGVPVGGVATPPTLTGATQIGALSCAGATCANGLGNETIMAASHPGTFSEQTRYLVTFGAFANGKSTVAISTQIAPGAVPEAATWAMMLVGFGGIGGALRSNRRKVTFA